MTEDAGTIAERVLELRDVIRGAREVIQEARAELRSLGAARMPQAVEYVLDSVAGEYEVTRDDLVRRGQGSRVAWLSRARQAAMLRLREELRLSVVEIGALLDRHHSTILYGIEQAKRDRKAMQA